MYKKTVFFLLLCISSVFLSTGCQKTPDAVIEKSKQYQNDQKVEKSNIKFVSISHILDHKEEILEKKYQNLDLKKSIHVDEIPETISILSMQVQDNFGSKETLEELSSAFFGHDRYRNEISRLDHTKATAWGVYAFHFENDDQDDGAIYDNGLSYLSKRGSRTLKDVKKIYHVDWGNELDDSYSLGGEKISVREAADFVQTWCDKAWKAVEPDYEYQVKNVYVCQAEKKSFYYCFDICKFYKGVPFDDISFYTDEDHIHPRTILNATMEKKDELSFFYNLDLSLKVQKEEKHDDALISLEQAILLVQDKMTGGQKFSIDDIDIKYVITSDIKEADQKKKIYYDSPGTTAKAHPVWSFTMDVSNDVKEFTSCWPRKFINVDMITGNVMYFDDISGQY